MPSAYCTAQQGPSVIVYCIMAKAAEQASLEVHRIVPGLYLGSEKGLTQCRDLNITHVLSVIENKEYVRRCDLSRLTHLHIQLHDEKEADLLQQLPDALNFIHSALEGKQLLPPVNEENGALASSFKASTVGPGVKVSLTVDSCAVRLGISVVPEAADTVSTAINSHGHLLTAHSAKTTSLTPENNATNTAVTVKLTVDSVGMVQLSLQVVSSHAAAPAMPAYSSTEHAACSQLPCIASHPATAAAASDRCLVTGSAAAAGTGALAYSASTQAQDLSQSEERVVTLKLSLSDEGAVLVCLTVGAEATKADSSKISAVPNVYVHCQKGISRSASVVIAYLMVTRKWGFDKARAYVKECRSIVYPNRSFRMQLKLFHAMNYKLDPTYPDYRMWRLQQMATALGHSQGYMPSLFYKMANPQSFASVPKEMEGGDDQAGSCRCLNCKALLVTASHVLGATEIAASNEWCEARMAWLKRNAMHLHLYISMRDRAITEDSSPGIFIEPMSWMYLDNVCWRGTLLCPGCNDIVGSYNWKGVITEQGKRVTPAFKLYLNKITGRPAVEVAAATSMPTAKLAGNTLDLTPADAGSPSAQPCDSKGITLSNHGPTVHKKRPQTHARPAYDMPKPHPMLTETQWWLKHRTEKKWVFVGGTAKATAVGTAINGAAVGPVCRGEAAPTSSLDPTLQRDPADTSYAAVAETDKPAAEGMAPGAAVAVTDESRTLGRANATKNTQQGVVTYAKGPAPGSAEFRSLCDAFGICLA